MNKLTYLIVFILVLFMALAGVFIWRKNVAKAPTKTQEQKTETPATENPPEAPKPNAIYPISGFLNRKIVNPFGRYFPPGGTDNPDREVCPNATYYPGYHTAVDLETTSEEQNAPVPIISIANGTVKRVESASGYGGIVVIEYNLKGQTYTAIYGHLDLQTVKLKEDAPINASDKIGELGQKCSISNGNVRKHLHFGLHKGTEIDIKGYVPTQEELSAWIDPFEFLKNQ